MDNSSDLPEGEQALYELATRSNVDPYRREAAIKKLGMLESEESNRQLEKVIEEGISAIERQLAETHLSAVHSDPSTDSSSLGEVDKGSSSLEEKLQQDNETLRETLRSSEESAETETESPDDG